MNYYLDLIKTIWKLLPLVLLIVIGILFYSYRSEHKKVKAFKELNQVQSKEIEKWKDEAGHNRARAEIAEIDAKHSKLVLGKNLQEVLRKEVGNIKRNLISYAAVKASTQGQFTTKTIDTIYHIDTLLKPLPAKAFHIHTPDLQFKGTYLPEKDTVLANYKITHNFDLFYYYKKPGKSPWNLFRRKKAVAEIKFHNHGSQADSIFTIVLERKKSWWRRLW